MEGMDIELGERVIACKAWRWMAGMHDTDGAVCVAVEDGRPTLWWCEACGGEVPEEDLPSDEPTIPDLTNSATLGCLLALVREAWGNANLHTLFGTQGMWTVIVEGNWHRGRLATSGPSHYTTEAKALVAALEAAP